LKEKQDQAASNANSTQITDLQQELEASHSKAKDLEEKWMKSQNEITNLQKELEMAATASSGSKEIEQKLKEEEQKAKNAEAEILRQVTLITKSTIFDQPSNHLHTQTFPCRVWKWFEG
jgi:hypothetical protein